jgi:hypothetical protein
LAGHIHNINLRVQESQPHPTRAATFAYKMVKQCASPDVPQGTQQLCTQAGVIQTRLTELEGVNQN